MGVKVLDASDQPIVRTITFQAGTVVPGHSGLSVAPAEVSVGGGAGGTATATVTLRDQYDNLANDTSVTAHFTVTGSAVFSPVPAQCTPAAGLTPADPKFGTCSVTLTDSVAETVDVGATIGGTAVLDSPQQVKFTTDRPPSGELSTFTVAQTAGNKGTPDASADGVDSWTATVTLRDDLGNPLPGKTVSLIHLTGPAGVRLSVGAFTDQGAGVYTAKITSLDAGTFDVTAAYDTTQIVVPAGQPNAGQPVVRQVIFQAGPVDYTTSSLAVDHTSVDVGLPVTATVTAKDSNGNLVGGQVVKFSVSPSATATFTPATAQCTTDNTAGGAAFGTCSVTLTDPKAEDVVLHATVPDTSVTPAVDKDVQNSPVTVTFNSTAPDPGSPFTVAPATQSAGSFVTAQITLRDARGNPLTGYKASDFTVTGASGGSPDATVAGFAESSPGVYTWNQVTSQKIGTFTFAAVVDGITLTARPQVEFTPGPICLSASECANPSTFAVTLNDQTANGTAQDQITAQALDIYGNPVEGAAVRVTDTSVAPLAGYLTPSTATATTDATGKAILRVASSKAGTYTATGSITPAGGTAGTPVPSGTITNIRFAPDNIDPRQSTLTVTPPSLVVANLAQAGVFIGDANKNPIPGVTVTLASDSPNVSFDGVTGKTTTTCVTGADGMCPDVPLTSKLVGTYHITATVPVGGAPTQISGSPASVTFTHDVLCMKNTTTCPDGSYVEVTKDGAVANNVATNEVTAHAQDAYGNAISGVSVATTSLSASMTVVSGATGTTAADGTAKMTYRSVDAGAFQAGVTLNGQTPYGSPATLTFAGALLDPALTTMAVTPAGPVSTGSQYTATITGRDSGNNLIKGGVVSFTLASGATFTETGGTTASCTTDANGNCAVHVTSVTTGTYTLAATTKDATNADRQITGSPKDLVFQPGVVCTTGTGCKTRVEVTVDGQSNDGVERDIATVYTFDANGNPVPGVQVASAAVDPSALSVQPASDIQVTNAAGVTTIWYTSTVATAGTPGHQANVTFGAPAQTVPGSPVSLQFGKPLDGTKSSFTVAPAGPLTVGTDAANTYTVTVTARDVSNNLLPGAVVTFAITPNNPVWAGGVNSCTTGTDGTCQVKVYSTKSGGFAITAAGGTTPVGSAQTVRWNADVPCFDPGCKTNVQVTTDYAVANGSARDIATVQVFDRFDNPVPGALVTAVAGNPAQLTVQQGVDATNDQGETTVWFTSRIAAGHPAAVSIVGHAMPQIMLNFVPGAWNATNSTLTVDRTTQSTGGQVKATVTLLDDNMNPVPGVQVSLGTDSTTARITPGGTPSAACTTAADGTCSVMVGDTVAHAVRVGATALQGTTATPLNGSPKTVTFTKPDKPVVNHPTPGQSTNDTTPVFDGTADPGTTITVTDEKGQELCTAVADPVTGAWSCTPSTPLDEGDHTVEVTATDSNGGVSDPTERTFDVDTTPPPAPVVTTPAPNVPIKDRTPKVSGTGEPDATVTVADENGTVLCTATVQPDSTWSCTPPNNKAFDDGDHTLHVTQTDPAGNTSPETTVPFVVDTTPPDKPVIDTANKAHIAGTAEAGSTVTVPVPGVPPPVTTTADAKGAWTIDTPAGAVDGTVEATATDKAGNVSPKATAWLDVTAPSLTVDTANKTEVAGTSDDPTATVVVAWPDGTKSQPVKVGKDGTWSVPTPPGMSSGPITVTATDPAGNSTSKDAQLNVDAPGAPVFTTANAAQVAGTAQPGTDLVVTWPDGSKSQPVHVGADGKWSMPTPVGMPSGTVRAVTTDQYGNTSPEGTAYLDTVPPAPPVVTKPTEGQPTNDTTPTIEGTAEPGSTVSVKDEKGNELCSPKPVADAQGNWTCTPTTPLDEGKHTIEVTATDKAGNQSDPAERSFVVDTTPPDAPVVTKPAAGQSVPTGTPEIAGTAEPDSTVTVKDENGDVLCTVTADSATGAWTCKPSTPLGEGDHTISVTATDPAGNTSPATTRKFDVDLTPPAPAVVITPAAGKPTNKVEPPVTGTAEPGATVTITDKNGDPILGCDKPITADPVTGAWSCTPTSPLPEGANEIHVVVTDAAGNKSPETVRKFVVDTTPPALDAYPTNGTQIDGTATDTNPGTTVTVLGPDGKTPVPGCQSVPVDSTGHFACTPATTLPDGATVTVVATDAAGNQSRQTVTVGAAWVRATYTVVHRGELEGSYGDRWVVGETVHVTVQSTPLDLGTITIRTNYSGVGPNFIVPSDFEIGTHTITWTGSVSGTHTTTFKVVANPKKTSVGTGGTVIQTGTPLDALAGLSLLGMAVSVTAVRYRRRHEA